MRPGESLMEGWLKGVGSIARRCWPGGTFRPERFRLRRPAPCRPGAGSPCVRSVALKSDLPETKPWPQVEDLRGPEVALDSRSPYHQQLAVLEQGRGMEHAPFRHRRSRLPRVRSRIEHLHARHAGRCDAAESAHLDREAILEKCQGVGHRCPGEHRLRPLPCSRVVHLGPTGPRGAPGGPCVVPAAIGLDRAGSLSAGRGHSARHQHPPVLEDHGLEPNVADHHVGGVRPLSGCGVEGFDHLQRVRFEQPHGDLPSAEDQYLAVREEQGFVAAPRHGHVGDG